MDLGKERQSRAGEQGCRGSGWKKERARPSEHKARASRPAFSHRPTSTSPAKGGVPEQAEWVANARPAPLEKSPRHQQSQPQRPGHARTESHLGHGGALGKTSSPVKGRVMSIWNRMHHRLIQR